MKPSKRVFVAGPSITTKEIDYVTQAIRTAWYDQANVFHDRFEKAFAEYLGLRHAVALPSCTSALHLALLALGIGPGDEVIVPEITWIATAAPVRYVGATPVFADVDPQTWCLAPDSFKTAITKRTKAVIPVDLYGNMPEMSAIRDIARRHRLAIIEDAAEAIGSEYFDQKAGSLGDVGVFSFHGSKTLTTGEGGMLVTDRSELHERVLFLRDHGRDPQGRAFWNTAVGYKYKMSSMQAALGLAQLERVGTLVRRKRQIFHWYQKELRNVPHVTLNCENSHVRNSYWMVTVLVDRSLQLEKEEIIRLLREKGIDCRPIFYPLSSLPAFETESAGKQYDRRNPVSYRLSPFGVNLPSSLEITKREVQKVCATFKRIVESQTRAAAA